MTPIQLAQAAVDAMNTPELGSLTLTVPKGGLPRNFPRGELLNEMRRGGIIECTYSFKPASVLAYLARHELVTVKRHDNPERITITENIT